MKKKYKFDLKNFFNKKENVAIVAVALVFCAGLAVTQLKAGNIPLHDGDVLVDSRNVAQVEENQETAENETAAENDAQGDNTEKEATFEEQRANLELQRNDLISRYDETIKNSTNDAEKKNAVNQKEKLTGYMEQEIAVEGLISSKNLPACLVIITDSTVTVTVDDKDLNQTTVAKICNIVMKETQRSADEIIIQSKY